MVSYSISKKSSGIWMDCALINAILPMMIMVESDLADKDALRIILEESALSKDDISSVLHAKDDNDCKVLYDAMVNQKQDFYFYQFIGLFKERFKCIEHRESHTMGHHEA